MLVPSDVPCAGRKPTQIIVAIQRRTPTRRCSPLSALVPLLNEMEGRGLVVRSRHPDDGRAAILQVSQKGRDVLERLELINDEVADLVLSSLTPEEQSRFHDLLKKVYEFLCKDDSSVHS